MAFTGKIVVKVCIVTDTNCIARINMVYLFSSPGMVKERKELNSWWFDVLTKSKKQRFGQVVHITWERGSIYFDTVKIWAGRAVKKGESCQKEYVAAQMVTRF